MKGLQFIHISPNILGQLKAIVLFMTSLLFACYVNLEIAWLVTFGVNANSWPRINQDGMHDQPGQYSR